VALTAAERAASHRARQQDKLARYSRMEAALTAIVEVVTPRQDKPVSQQILAIAQEGLAS
jgi:hypothetical protein